MKNSPLPRALAVIFAAGLANFPTTAAACTVCMGDVNSNTATAINAAIFLMLGCIGSMLAAAAGFGIYLMKRADSPLPPHAELAEMIPPPEDNQ